MRNEQVVQAWKEGRKATNYSVTLHTDGSDLWSYNLLIGVSDGDGRKIVLGYARALGGPVISQTTSSHVLLAARVADIRPVEDFDL